VDNRNDYQARGALIYKNSTVTIGGSSIVKPVIAVLDFGSDKSSSASNFTIQFPAVGSSPTGSTAILKDCIMAVSLLHNFVSGKLDGTDATLVQPSNWNAEHTLQLGTGKLLGRTTASTGAAEEIAVAGTLTLATGTLTGTGATTGKAIAIAIVFS